MIKLVEILHMLQRENEDGYTEIDRWNILHADYLENMDFKPDGMYKYSLHKPKIKVSHRKHEGFVVEDIANDQKHTFRKFKEVEDFFTNYKQKWSDAPYTSEEEPEAQDNGEISPTK